MNTPTDLKYTKQHEWVKLNGKTAIIGVTEHAQEQLGDIVYVELPDVADFLKKEESFGVLESVKAVSDCYAPLSGRVLEVNDALFDAPELVNDDCYGEGWMVKLELDDNAELNELLSAQEYTAFVKEETT